MKLIRGAEAEDVELSLVGDYYEFPCGCKFRARPDHDKVNGHFPIVLDRDMPLDCPLVWEMLAAGATIGVFQLESRLGKTYAVKLKPTCMEHLSALVALLRPGCLQVKDEDGVSMTDSYCLRKNGLAEAKYSVEALRPYLESSYGVMLYQEIIMLIAKELAGFDLVKLDRIRKGIGKKDLEILAKIGKEFVDDAEVFGKITRDEATKIFEDMKKSGRYLFNKAHSVTYAYGTYESAYFKAHFPVYFYTSYLKMAKHKIDPQKEVRNLIRDARRFGVPVLTPRFSRLESDFSTDGVEIRFGLTDVKGVGSRVVTKIQAELTRDRLLDWTWFDFLKLGVSACGVGTVRSMIQAGAMEDYKLQRQRMLAELEAWNSLTAVEQRGVVQIDRPLTKVVPVHEKQVVYTEQGDGKKPRKKTLNVKVGEEVVVVDEARPASGLEGALEALLARPGAVTKGRRPKVESVLALLQNPPYPLVDTPHLIAKFEEETLGVPITTKAMDRVDRSILNCTMREFRDGKDGRDLLVMGGKVVEVFERVVKNGDNRGAKMASLVITDGEQTLDDVVVFPEAWSRYGLVLMRPGALVALGGKRNFRNPDGFIVERVWSL